MQSFPNCRVAALACAASVLAAVMAAPAAAATLAVDAATIVQRGAPWRVSGTSGSDAAVSVLWGGQAYRAQPVNGRWSVELPVPADAKGPATISLQGSGSAQTVLVGDVWVCSGQSNIAWTTQRSTDAEQILRGIESAPIRLYKALPDRRVQSDPTPRWERPDARSAARFSAVCLAFGKELARLTGVPQGLIEAAVGASRIQSWMARAPESVLPPAERRMGPGPGPMQRGRPPGPGPGPGERGDAGDAAGADPQGGRLGPRLRNEPNALFRAVVAPLAATPVRGVVWYQGESNRGNGADYERLLAALMADWRSAWRRDLAFTVFQLPGTGAEPVAFNEFGFTPALREGQHLAVAKDRNAVLVPTIDLGDGSLHPPEKLPFGVRAAQNAYRQFYERKPARAALPRPQATPSGSKLVVDLAQLAEAPCLRGAIGEGVRIAGADGVWTPAQAELTGTRLVASAPGVAAPVALRYAWGDRPPAALHDCAIGQPLAPFRTDDWPLRRAAAAVRPPGARPAEAPAGMPRR